MIQDDFFTDIADIIVVPYVLYVGEKYAYFNVFYTWY